MDVRCDQCRTEYELDETRISEAGLTVKCTQCGNIFKVRKPYATTPALESPPPKEWRVRRQDGQQLSLRNLTELQRWIVERRVGPDDEVSLSGETWRKLGTLPELGAFFEVVKVAERNRSPGAVPSVSQDVAMSDTMMGIPAPDGSAYSGRSKTPAWSGQPLPGSSSTEPAWANGSPSVDIDLDDQLSPEDLKHLKGGRGGTWAVLIVIFLVIAGAAAWFWRFPSSPPGTLPAPKMEPLPSLEPTATPAPEVVAPPAPAQAEVAKPTPQPDAKPQPEAKPAAEVKAPTQAVPEPRAVAAVKEPSSEGGAIPSGKGINFYLAQGHRLLDSKPELALKYFAKAGEVDPQSPEPDSGRGLAYSNMERWNDAISAFQTSLKRNPEYTEAIMGLAEAYRAQGSLPNKRKALALYQRYLDLTPDGPDAPVAKAQVEILSSDLRSAPAQTTPPPAAEAAPSKLGDVLEPPTPAAAPSEPAAVPSEVQAPPPVLAPDSVPKQNAP